MKPAPPMTQLLLVTPDELGLRTSPADPRVMRALGGLEPRGVLGSDPGSIEGLPPGWRGSWDGGLAELEAEPDRDPGPWLRARLGSGCDSRGGPWLLVVSPRIKAAWLHRALAGPAGTGGSAPVGESSPPTGESTCEGGPVSAAPGLLALEWPRGGGSGPAGGLRLGGLDLDRLPAVSSGGHEPFPGAPGSAPSRA